MTAVKRIQKGFTLVELMVVVAIIGILAAIGLPQLGAYIKQAETTEPSEQLASIAKNIQGYVDSHPGLTIGTTLNGTTVLQTGAGTLTALIPTIAIQSGSKWKYTVGTIGVGATNRIVYGCLFAELDSAVGTVNNTGKIFYSTSDETNNATTLGWEGHFYRLNYVKGSGTVTPGVETAAAAATAGSSSAAPACS